MFSSAKRYNLFEENNNKSNNMNNIIQGKKINFNEEVSNLNLIQNKNNSNIYKSALKEEKKSPSFLFPPKPNSNNDDNNLGPIPNSSYQIPNQFNFAPNASNQTQVNIINYDNNIINGEIKEKNNINQINGYVHHNIPKVKCTCTRTQCQKKYCFCFSHGIPCQGCECKGCLNTPKAKIKIDYEENELIEEDNNLLTQNAPLCNCTKSHCLKKYCECYKINRNCGSLCRCFECKNKEPFVNNNNIINNAFDEEENFKEMNNYGENINNIENLKEISKAYNINAFAIFIQNNSLILQEREVDLTDKKINIITTPKLTNKTRSRARNENSNLQTCPTTNSNSRRSRRAHVNSNVQTKKLNLN